MGWLAGSLSCAQLAPSFWDGPKDQTRNLEIPDSRFARSGMTAGAILRQC